mmetsp:Transcript_65921/g.153179  ORF Transcript_65921/g.153179 Transcript_65921/m.153179 type:complete len:297 (+) Transcript_65921:2382-3272(+)
MRFCAMLTAFSHSSFNCCDNCSARLSVSWLSVSFSSCVRVSIVAAVATLTFWMTLLTATAAFCSANFFSSLSFLNLASSALCFSISRRASSIFFCCSSAAFLRMSSMTLCSSSFLCCSSHCLRSYSSFCLRASSSALLLASCAFISSHCRRSYSSCCLRSYSSRCLHASSSALLLASCACLSSSCFLRCSSWSSSCFLRCISFCFSSIFCSSCFRYSSMRWRLLSSAPLRSSSLLASNEELRAGGGKPCICGICGICGVGAPLPPPGVTRKSGSTGPSQGTIQPTGGGTPPVPRSG